MAIPTIPNCSSCRFCNIIWNAGDDQTLLCTNETARQQLGIPADQALCGQEAELCSFYTLGKPHEEDSLEEVKGPPTTLPAIKPIFPEGGGN